MFTIDTNILVYYGTGEKSVREFVINNLERDTVFFLPTIAVVEFFSFPDLTMQDRVIFQSFISDFRLISLDLDISFWAAHLRRNHKLKLADAVIAATAIFTGSTLLTRNTRDFQKVSNLSVLKI